MKEARWGEWAGVGSVLMVQELRRVVVNTEGWAYVNGANLIETVWKVLCEHHPV